jgi:hypothetical protein
LRAEEDQRRYAVKFKINAVENDLIKSVDGDPNDVVDLGVDILRKPVDVEDNSMDIEEIKVAKQSSRTLSFRKKRRGLSPHRLLLKECMKDRTISYVDLLWPDLLPPRLDPRRKPQASTRLP